MTDLFSLFFYIILYILVILLGHTFFEYAKEHFTTKKNKNYLDDTKYKRIIEEFPISDPTISENVEQELYGFLDTLIS